MTTSITKSAPPPLLWVPTGYFAMAMGYVMLTSVTAIMFKNLGMDNGRAAQYSSMLILAYTIKPLFAPVVEMYRTKKFFVLLTQVALALGFAGVALAMGMPDAMALMMGLFWIMSFVGATMDIASDGVYVTSLDTRSQSLYCGVQSLSWNIGPVFASGVLVYLSGRLHADVFHHDRHAFGPDWIASWRVIFLIVAVLLLLLSLWHARAMPEGARAADTPASLGQAGRILRNAFTSFFDKPGVWRMVAFALLYRVSIGLLEKIGPFFMVDPVEKGGLGMSNELLGIVYGTYGLLAVLAGSLLGGWYVARRGLRPVLFTLCCTLNIPIATFLAMAIYQPSDLYVIGAGVVIEKFAFGFGSVGFMIYLMQQLAPGRFATTHYAFGTGLMGMCGMLTGMASGYLQEALGYVNYFWLVMAATIPSFIATWYAPFHHAEEGGA
ncbi:MFS transporter [Massilia sp. TS11]|uniref:MFS transporter n=1 Tax=Massilia sp. TS11 TaxID=2908003 RepID=UPI001EDC8E90|nr:MFS transporter [Massilia sp. TS11]MCG2586288.1 MFS transporter [Massilia sp. TS11]